MRKKPTAVESLPTRPVLQGPEFDDRALVVTLAATRDEAVHASLGTFASGGEAGGPIEALLRYLGERKGAVLTALYPERTPHFWKHGNWELAIPDPDNGDGALAGIHHLRLSDSREREELELKLRSLPVVESVHRPVVQYPQDVERTAPAAASTAEQWGLDRCGFPDIWARMDGDDEPRRIAVIDQGEDMGHPDLKGRIHTCEVPRRGTRPSNSVHACAVSGIVSAIRERPEARGIDGCCSSQIDLYNVWTGEGEFDSLAYYSALKAVACKQTPVLNLSMGSSTRDKCIEKQVRECITRGVIVVAAMGSEGKTIYPAAHDDVIAVGATVRSDRPASWSGTGAHLFISAPGEHIRTVTGNGRHHTLSGTSYSAPMVSAAIWLILRSKPSWGLAQVKQLLMAYSAVPKGTVAGTRSNKLGYGRLDMNLLWCGLNKGSRRSP